MAGTSSSGRASGMGGSISELKDLVLTYAKQQTLDPLKALGRYVGYGALGAILVAVGGAILTLAVLRMLQFEPAPHLNGNLSWVPYVGALLFAASIVGLMVWRITNRKAR